MRMEGQISLEFIQGVTMRYRRFMFNGCCKIELDMMAIQSGQRDTNIDSRSAPRIEIIERRLKTRGLRLITKTNRESP